jgi:hypothetical protein
VNNHPDAGYHDHLVPFFLTWMLMVQEDSAKKKKKEKEEEGYRGKTPEKMLTEKRK